MIRLLAFSVTCVALVLGALSARNLIELRSQTPADTAAAVIGNLPAQTSGTDEPQPPRRWPDLFGREAVAEPQPPAPPEPEPEPPAPPEPPMPPVESLGFSLKGIVGNGDTYWAILSHPTGDVLLRAGEELAEGYVVSEIDATGLWIEAGGTRSRFEFVE